MSASQDPSSRMLVPLVPETVLQHRYRIVRRLGRGGMGAVYEAVDQRLGITVALKETFSTDPSVRRQFEQEARLLAAMDHPALPRVSDYFVESERAFLVMEFIVGMDLARIIAQQPGPFPRDQVIAWADQLLEALIYLHTRERQVIHRDIKPHNLKLRANGQIALLDFGLARTQSTESSNTSSTGVFGYTRQYAPLEQIQDRRTDARSDIYALGATLYHLLTGVKPPDAVLRAAAMVNGERDPLRRADAINPAIGAQITTIVMKAMAQKAGDRFASAGDFREALRRIRRIPKAGEKPSNVVEQVNEAPHEVQGISMDMIVSDRGFGPGTLTILIVSLLLLAAGLFYGSQQWSISGPMGSGNSGPQAGPAAVNSHAVIRIPDSEKPNITPAGTRRVKSANSAPRREYSRHTKRVQPPLVSAPPVRLPTFDISNTSNPY